MWFVGAPRNTASIGHITTANTVAAQYNVPNASSIADLVTGSDGAFWFIQMNNSDSRGSIGRMTTTGMATQYTVSGSPLVSDLVGLVAGSDGNLWFWNSKTSSVEKLTTSGTFTAYPVTLSANAAVSGLTFGPDGNLWLAVDNLNADGSNNGGIVYQVNTAGTVLNSYALPGGSASHPGNIKSGPDGNLWLIDSGTNAIDKVSTGGTITTYAAPSGTTVDGNGKLAVANGELWFIVDTPIATTLDNITTSGTYGSYTLPSGDNPGYLATGSAGSLWYANNGIGGVGRITF
jgi:virginiamycin B lyase